MPGRPLTLDFASPLEGFDANARFFYSMNQLLGRLNDSAGVLRGMDEESGGRLALAALAVYTAYGMRYYSHEIAHDHALRSHGLGEHVSLDFGSWHSGWPEYEMIGITTSSYAALLGDAAIFERYLAGLNQDETDSRLAWASSADCGTVDLQGAASFLVQKARDLGYIATTGLTDRRPSAPPLTFEDAADYVTANGLEGDVDDYVICLMVNGVDLSKEEYLAQVLVADLLSWHTWECVRAVGRYLRTGERTMRLATWRVSDRLEMTPPLISCYITPLGTFYDVAAILDPAGARPVTVSVGTDVDFIGGGKVDRLRFGAQVHGVGRGPCALAPFAYLNASRADGHEGASVGVEGLFRFHPRMRLRVTLEHNEGDVIENTVKGKEEGFWATLGLDASF
ncbi:MAG: hypothetical protein ACYTKD_02905 [Planctomycetota bacterium]